MAGIIFIDDEDEDEDEIDIDDVNGCSDEKQLREWHDGLTTSKDRVTERIKAFRLAGTRDERWFHGAGGRVAYLGIGIRRVERRMKELGLASPNDPHGHGKRIADLQEKNRKLRALLQTHGIEEDA